MELRIQNVTHSQQIVSIAFRPFCMAHHITVDETDQCFVIDTSNAHRIYAATFNCHNRGW